MPYRKQYKVFDQMKNIKRQAEFDEIAICPKCETPNFLMLDFCETCGRKINRERPGESDEPIDLVGEMNRTFGTKVCGWLFGIAMVDSSTFADVVDYTFNRETRDE